MATAGGDVTNKRESLTCALCLDIYTSPKALPCLHTFCEQCLKDLTAQHPSGTFPCPTCREEATVPPGGVSAFQTHFHIDPQDLERARDNTHCMTHLTKELEFFCIKCDQAICINCKLTEHENHKTQDLLQAAAKAKIKLSENVARIERCVKLAKKNADDARPELQGIQDKKTELTAVIHRRRDVIVAMVTEAADKYRDEALASLNEMTDRMKNKQEKEVEITQHNLQELTKLQQRVQQAVDSGAGCERVTVAREMRCGRDSEEAVQKLTTKQMTTVRRPVLRFSATHDTILERMRDYMGSAAKMEMAVSAPEVTVMEQFRCREDPDTDVYHVCPMTDGKVWVSYEPSMMREGGTSEKFNADGKVGGIKKFDARITTAPRKNGKSMLRTSKTGETGTFAKRIEPQLSRFFGLKNNLTGQATVYTVKIVSEHPLETESTKEFRVDCAAHRAFDVDASEQLFVVLEEAQAPDLQRTVRLYRRPQPDAIATYSPPVAPFQPSDECFYTLGGHEVLLVADELNDAIHVVNMQDGRLSFARYLAPGCPLLVQPTALNTDTRGRLWVACRGGRIITCEPVATANQ